LSKQSVIIIIALITSASIALAVSILYLPQLQPKGDTGPGLRFDNETFFRSAAPFGHKLAIMASYSENETSVGVGNPSGYQYKDCTVVMETVVAQDIVNTTLKTYDRILPHTYDYFTAQLDEGGYNADNVPDWLILECKEPQELATNPGIFIGKLDYRAGENVTLKGMIGYSEVTVRVLDGDGNTSLEKKVATDNGFLKYSFKIPDNARPGTWSVQVESSVILGQDFTVINT
jgi:hypothetical protein